jgi:hypothetical protein
MTTLHQLLDTTALVSTNRMGLLVDMCTKRGRLSLLQLVVLGLSRRLLSKESTRLVDSALAVLTDNC